MATVFLGLGSNIDPEQNLQKAAALLRERWPDAEFSSVYRSAPVGFERQDDFLNAAARIETDEDPAAVRAALTEMENQLGKATPFANGPRTIDLDILLVDDRVIKLPGLEVPHPRLHERRFVLEPLCELLDPHTRHPTLGKSLEAFLEASLDQSCDLIETTL